MRLTVLVTGRGSTFTNVPPVLTLMGASELCLLASSAWVTTGRGLAAEGGVLVGVDVGPLPAEAVGVRVGLAVAAGAAGAGAFALARVVCRWTTAAGGAVGGTGRGDVPVATAPPTIETAMAPAATLAARGVARSACWPTRVTMRARQRWAQRPRAGASPSPAMPASLSSPVRARNRVRK